MIDQASHHYFWKGPLSQWHKDDFVVLGTTYNCAEQFMMANKAALFQDYESVAAILRSNSPRVQKDFGRTVNGFDSHIWDRCKEKIVYMGNLAKFSQNEDLKKILLATAPKLLVECNPKDCIWGVGLAANDPLVRNKATWRGQNLLGKILTEVREEIINNGL